MTATECKKNAKIFVTSTIQFLFILGFIYVYAYLFGNENILAGIAIVMALLMYPICDTGVRPLPMALLYVVLFVGSGIISTLSYYNLWLGFLLNGGFIFVSLLFTCEPIAYKPHMAFLLSYIFCQSVPVSGHAVVLRMTALAVGGVLVAVVSLLFWYKRGYSLQGRTLRQQAVLCFNKHKGFLFRMAIGVAIAMFVGQALGLQKPLWISIVVMSLTQIEFDETIQRIKYRLLATVVGAALFIVVCQLILPPQYIIVFVMFLGYLGNFKFAKQYKYQQSFNAISALNASMLLFDSVTAIESRFICLASGIVIVLCIYFAYHHLRKFYLAQKREDGKDSYTYQGQHAFQE